MWIIVSKLVKMGMVLIAIDGYFDAKIKIQRNLISEE